jgi:hypothetical protein
MIEGPADLNQSLVLDGDRPASDCATPWTVLPVAGLQQECSPRQDGRAGRRQKMSLCHYVFGAAEGDARAGVARVAECEGLARADDHESEA